MKKHTIYFGQMPNDDIEAYLKKEVEEGEEVKISIFENMSLFMYLHGNYYNVYVGVESEQTMIPIGTYKLFEIAKALLFTAPKVQ